MPFVRSQAYCADVARYGIDCLVIALGIILYVCLVLHGCINAMVADS